MLKKNVLMAVVLAGLIVCSPVLAKEGNDQYPNGAETWYAGALPPPGTYFLNYAIYYSGKLKDGGGKNAVLGTTTPSVHAVADALRIVHVTNVKVLGANWALHAIVPFADQNMDINASGGANNVASIGDITFDPFVLTWHSPEWHFATGLDINAPTGLYSKGGLGSNGFNSSDPRRDIGQNYWSFEPIFATTYLNQDGWEASGKFMLNFKTKNYYTDYQSGHEFHIDYLLGKHFGPWGVGISGYFLKQLNDDTQGGSTVTSTNYFGQSGVFSDGRSGQVFAYGPSVLYQLDSGQQFQLMWNHETLLQNRFGGDKVIFKFVTGLW